MLHALPDIRTVLLPVQPTGSGGLLRLWTPLKTVQQVHCTCQVVEMSAHSCHLGTDLHAPQATSLKRSSGTQAQLRTAASDLSKSGCLVPRGGGGGVILCCKKLISSIALIAKHCHGKLLESCTGSGTPSSIRPTSLLSACRAFLAHGPTRLWSLHAAGSDSLPLIISNITRALTLHIPMRRPQPIKHHQATASGPLPANTGQRDVECSTSCSIPSQSGNSKLYR